jgi:hypothetical protein
MHYGRSRYVKVINEDGGICHYKVVVKQLHYMPITSRLKRLFLCKETTQLMRWQKVGIHDSKIADIMSHPVATESWHTLDRFDPEFVGGP